MCDRITHLPSILRHVLLALSFAIKIKIDRTKGGNHCHILSL